MRRVGADISVTQKMACTEPLSVAAVVEPDGGGILFGSPDDAFVVNYQVYNLSGQLILEVYDQSLALGF